MKSRRQHLFHTATHSSPGTGGVYPRFFQMNENSSTFSPCRPAMSAICWNANSCRNQSWSLVSLDDYGTVPRSPTDLFARDKETGLYHEVVASTQDGVTSLEVDQEGVIR